jgi:4-aminobutyrate aminotransferase-like enzyme
LQDKESREPATELAKTILTTLKQRHILIQLDGPCCNVIKLKPPMVFSIENAKKLVENVEDILSNLNK